MRLADLAHGQATTLVLEASGVEPLREAVDRPLDLVPATVGDRTLLARRDATGEIATWTIAGEDAAQTHELARVLDRGSPRIVYAVVSGDDQATEGRLIVQVHEFASEHTWHQPVRIGIGDAAADAVRRAVGRTPSQLSAERVGDILAAWLLLPTPEGPPRSVAAITLGKEAIEGDERSFWMHGARHSAKVAKQSDDGLLVERVTPLLRNAGGEHDPWQLMRGELTFVDATTATALRAAASAELDALVRGAGSYLRQWSRYNELERRRVIDRARSAGTVRYEKVTETSPGAWRFSIAGDDRDAVATLVADRRESLAAAQRLPDELMPDSGLELPRNRKARSGFMGDIVKVAPDHRTIDIESSSGGHRPPPEGFLFTSLVGDQTRLDRRETARDAIVSSSCPMPQLGLLLEGRPVSVSQRTKHFKIPPAVEARFRDTPTDRQRDALRVAMNTPDIALIQGPPGTGKTAVISALATWLAEDAEKGGDLAKSILLTSYQHDAVDNAAERTTVLDLPALRVTSKPKREPPTAWAHALARTLENDATARGGGALLAARGLQADIRTHALVARRPLETAMALEDTAADGTELLPGELRERLLRRARELRHPPQRTADRERLALRRALHGLRTSSVSFADDGPRMAAQLAVALERAQRGTDADHALLRRAATLADADFDAATLQQLAQLRSQLIGEVVIERRRPTDAPVFDEVSRRLLAEAAFTAAETERTTLDGVTRVLADLAEDLKADVLGTRRTLGNYASVLAATCQHAGSRAMALEKAADIEFATVIVDEAARANPLDLMIPLAQARRRIVLVGDHRQLPHVLEPEVERELDADVAEETRAALRQSLFERLFEDLAARERADGIQRVVTLDRQFRMHPVLGEFVNRSFYAPHGTPLLSPRPALDFPVELPVTDSKPAAWIDVAEGREHPRQQSKSRLAEARWIAGVLEPMLDKAPTLSFGVISFYTAQVDLIMRELVKVGLAAREEDDEIRIVPAWRQGHDDDGRSIDRLRVGTVDAVQGREFDVVLLSLARSSQGKGGTPKDLRRRFGHLMLENRLCVAMSRQRRALIVVGDAEQMTGPQGVAAVPALAAFHELCEGEHGVVVSA